MIDQDRLACAHSRESVTNHIRKHLHLTSPLHINHREHKNVPPFGNADTCGVRLQNTLMRELSILQNYSSFKDPPVSPSCWQNQELVAIADKVPSASHNVSEHAKKENSKGRGALRQKRKIKQRRATHLKIFVSRGTNLAKITRGQSSASSKIPCLKRLPADKSNILPCESKAHNLAHDKSKMPCCTENHLFTRHATSSIGLSTIFDKESVPLSNSFAVKYAPKSFTDIFGQHVVTSALSNALSSRRVAPMYIFYGPHGTGKTSCANLFALALNCLSIDKNRPCWTCRLCLAQLSGKFSPIKKVDSRVKHISCLMRDVVGAPSFLYRVCLVEECSSFSSRAWNALLKGIKGASKKTVFIFSTVNLEHVPHAIASQCQKFYFSNVSERDIICKLQQIVLGEGLNAETKAIELIASTSKGSLGDAELMLDHCCSLRKKVTVLDVQHLVFCCTPCVTSILELRPQLAMNSVYAANKEVGLISDSKLMELLHFAFSAERLKTLQSLKEFFDTGVTPINLLSQLASLITRMLAGGHYVPRSEQEHDLFCEQEYTKNETQRLRQALRILSEAEKQVQGSPSSAMWLTAALLQFAPDLPHLASSCSGLSLTQSSVRESADSDCDFLKASEVPSIVEKPCKPCMLAMTDATGSTVKDITNLSTSVVSFNHMQKYLSSKVGQLPAISKGTSSHAPATPITKHDTIDGIIKQPRETANDDLQQVWQRVLDAINSNNLRCFLQAEGKLVSLSRHEDYTEALLQFHSLQHLSRVQRSKASILHAFRSTLGHHIEVRAHLVSCANQWRRSSSSTEAAKVGPSHWTQLMRGDNTCVISGFLTSTEDTGFRHGSPETEGAWEPQILSDVVPALVSQRGMKKFSLEASKRGKQPSMSKPMVRGDINKHLSKKANSKQGCKLELQFDNMIKTPRGDFVGVTFEKGKTLATAAARLEEENLKKETKVKEGACWKAGTNISKAVENFQFCSEHARSLCSFIPCASIQRSPRAL
ncbi:hypothetical protein L7F22_060451 [Adiantum nelumboides]|nr:hypothetical protein [Adiantum nelumboides]